MGIVKSEDVIAWDVNGEIHCCDCCDGSDDEKPITEKDVSEGDIVICDRCGARIQ